MEITQVEVLEQKLNRAFKTAIYFQCFGVLVLGLLFCFEPVGYKKIGLVFSILAFISSVLISRPYFYAEKRLGESKMARSKSVARKFNERFLLFYFPYTFWCSLIGVFL